jgi:hypothetical protein
MPDKMTLMPKQMDALKQFTALRTALEHERTQIQQRLKDIDAALSGGEVPFVKHPTEGLVTATQRRAPAKRARTKLTVREAIAQATADKPLSVREIVEAMRKLGYKFKSKKPENSVGAYLYGPEGKKHFKRVDGKFATTR